MNYFSSLLFTYFGGNEIIEANKIRARTAAAVEEAAVLLLINETVFAFVCVVYGVSLTLVKFALSVVLIEKISINKI